MDATTDPAADPTAEIHEPYTVAENIKQLLSIDDAIARLMKHATSALSALGDPSAGPSVAAAADPSANPSTTPSIPPPSVRQESFEAATHELLTSLHSIDVRMKRQIWALEEHGIVNLDGTGSSSNQRSDGNGAAEAPLRSQAGSGSEAKAAGRVSLTADGVGAVGGLDVGWLNSRMTAGAVERDIESELWTLARELLEKRAQAVDGGVKLEADDMSH